MGSSNWSTDAHHARRAYQASAGSSGFDYHDDVTSTPRDQWRAHASLDPRGVTMRESRDSEAHPNSLAVSVLFDVTGSMGRVPRALQAKLPDLFGLLLRRGYVQDPQILFGAIGDATCDRVPLQVGQFESGNELEDDLGNILLEGGGGGQMTESYELAMYFMARHTALDCLEKRGRRGYLFIVGDEMAYGAVKAREVREVIGDDLDGDVALPKLLEELRSKYEVYFLMPTGSYHFRDDRVRKFWERHLGQNLVLLDDLDAVCETIAVTVGLGEEAIDLEEGLRDLADAGSDQADVVGRALRPLARGRGAVATSPDLEGLAGDGPGVDRL
ncbi:MULTISPECIES: hypothetical protein [unclassified Nocardiopsis]|jgi:hypothetical protein|uniref:hypothetical protein n=1 Tax=unclassified Nocardiopsis TaxID=2649073 RepID=UPI00066CFAAF|nr:MULTISPECIES: hypothetical protein [unclassified Nocardiopsis]MBQ1083645.1 hypothetical protein [Nocardiopsis sp. B62]